MLQEEPGREREIGDPIKRLRDTLLLYVSLDVGFTALMIDDPSDSMSWHDR